MRAGGSALVAIFPAEGYDETHPKAHSSLKLITFQVADLTVAF